jgi:hypothetical protein
LAHPPAVAEPLLSLHDDAPDCAEAHRYGDLVFLSNFCEDSSDSYEYNARSYYLTNNSVVVINYLDGAAFFNTSTVKNDDDGGPNEVPVRISIQNWKYMAEPVAYGKYRSFGVSPEQLNITNNDSDYLWYSFVATNMSTCDRIVVEKYGWDGMYYVYVDGDFQLDDASLAMTSRGLRQYNVFSTRIDILSVAMGLANYGVG